VVAKAVSAQGTSKTIAGSVNVAVVCAGASISPGDVIVADADGVVVVPRESAKAMVEATGLRLAREERTRARLKSGELGLDIHGLRNVLAERGVVWRD
jgi:4-hydroxy-4-methyl-2-oxoglutarate aldolase